MPDDVDEVLETIRHLEWLVELEAQVITHQREAVVLLRTQGASWGVIADAVGLTRQGAWSRFHFDIGEFEPPEDA